MELEKRTIVRSMLQHEDTLRDQRLSWLLTLNGFLFAALSFAWRSSVALALILAGVGIAVAGSSWATLRVSELAFDTLRRQVAADPSAAPVSALTSEDIKQSRKWLDRQLPNFYTWNVIPLVLLAAWMAVVVVRVVLWLR